MSLISHAPFLLLLLSSGATADDDVTSWDWPFETGFREYFQVDDSKEGVGSGYFGSHYNPTRYNYYIKPNSALDYNSYLHRYYQQLMQHHDNDHLQHNPYSQLNIRPLASYGAIDGDSSSDHDGQHLWNAFMNSYNLPIHIASHTSKDFPFWNWNLPHWNAQDDSSEEAGKANSVLSFGDGVIGNDGSSEEAGLGTWHDGFQFAGQKIVGYGEDGSPGGNSAGEQSDGGTSNDGKNAGGTSSGGASGGAASGGGASGGAASGGAASGGGASGGGVSNGGGSNGNGHGGHSGWRPHTLWPKASPSTLIQKSTTATKSTPAARTSTAQITAAPPPNTPRTSSSTPRQTNTPIVQTSIRAITHTTPSTATPSRKSTTEGTTPIRKSTTLIPMAKTTTQKTSSSSRMTTSGQVYTARTTVTEKITTPRTTEKITPRTPTTEKNTPRTTTEKITPRTTTEKITPRTTTTEKNTPRTTTTEKNTPRTTTTEKITPRTTTTEKATPSTKTTYEITTPTETTKETTTKAPPASTTTARQITTSTAVTTTPTPSTTDRPVIPDVCEGSEVTNNVGYKSHWSDCSKFIQCSFRPDGSTTVYIKTCANGTLWDQTTMSCNQAHLVDCPFDRCKMIGLERYPSDISCRSYFLCRDGKSHSVCCPPKHSYDPIQRCVPDELCLEECKDKEIVQDVCDRRPIPNRPLMFEEFTDGRGWAVMACAPGTAYNDIACQCTVQNNITSPQIECGPELYIPFNGDVKDESGNNNYLQVDGVKVIDGTGYFDGKSVIRVPRFSNLDIGNRIIVKLRYKEDGGRGAANGPPQALVANGDCNSPSSLYLVAGHGHMDVGLQTEEGRSANISIPSSGASWKEALLVVDKNVLVGALNGISYKTLFQGSIEASKCALQIGRGTEFAHFHGYMDDITVYLCKPKGF